DIEWLTSLARLGDESADVQRIFSTVGDLWTQRVLVDRARAASEKAKTAQEARVAQLSDGLAAMTSECVDARKRLESTTSAYAELQTECVDARKRLESMTCAYAELQTERVDARKRLESMTGAYAELQKEVACAQYRDEVRTVSERARQRRRLRIQATIHAAELEQRALLVETLRVRRARRSSVRARLWAGSRLVIGSRLKAAGLSRRHLATRPHRALRALLDPVSVQSSFVEASGLFDPVHYIAQCPSA